MSRAVRAMGPDDGATRGRRVVAQVDGEVVGCAVARPGRDDPPVREAELWMPYLRAAHQGSGLGRALLDAVPGDGPASLRVFADDPRAHASYGRNGFVPDGAEQPHERAEGVRIVRLVR